MNVSLGLVLVALVVVSVAVAQSAQNTTAPTLVGKYIVGV